MFKVISGAEGGLKVKDFRDNGMEQMRSHSQGLVFQFGKNSGMKFLLDG